ncbi:cyclic di-GMP binding protein [Klebsiella pneumoniae]|uniref:Cyclic di-GMP binding protein n=1 Tax=Klebsiella pneumoniae TaxID=573 RepID=A0A377XL31_KLEPN|nr:cyclic di-GMP binding protein [Klebsiella pneumoniae]
MPTGGGDLQSLRERDVLAVTALDQQAFNQSLLADSPYRPVDNVLSVREPDLWQKVQRRLTGRLDFRQPRRRSLLFVEQRLARVHQLSLAVEFHPPGGGGAGQQ